MGTTGTSEVFLGADGLVYSNGRAPTQRFREPLITLWHHLQKGSLCGSGYQYGQAAGGQ